jgi:ribosomal protein S3AE
MKCKVAYATRSIWHRGDEIISDALNIKTELQHRIQITGDKTLGEYNLQISQRNNIRSKMKTIC